MARIALAPTDEEPIVPAASFARQFREEQYAIDAHFDALLPIPLRVVSYRFWTPIRVAMSAVTWLRKAGATRVLDVGSGVGKFCIIGGLSSPLQFVGVEQRPHLVETSQQLARAMAIDDRVQFLWTEAHRDVALPNFDGLYFYNPFGENIFEKSSHLDATVELGGRRFAQDVTWAEHLLDRLAPGTPVATYNGFGGCLPDSFDLLDVRVMGLCVLRLWKKSNRAPGSAQWVEESLATVLYEGLQRLEPQLLVLPKRRRWT